MSLGFKRLSSRNFTVNSCTILSKFLHCILIFMKCINIYFAIFIKILHQEVNKYPVVIYKAKSCEKVSGVPK